METYFIELDLSLVTNPDIKDVEKEQHNSSTTAVLSALIKYGEAVIGVYSEDHDDINGPHDVVAITYYSRHGL